jgi:hypothetical protein
MIGSIKNNLKAVLLLVSFALVFSVGNYSCGPDASDDEILDEFIGLVSDHVSHTHIKGTDPCPQDIAQKAEVVCSHNDSECEVDSAVITNISPGLTAQFENGQMSSALTHPDFKQNLISFTFTCAMAESFTHKYTVKLYKSGVFVSQEDLEMVITVR